MNITIVTYAGGIILILFLLSGCGRASMSTASSPQLSASPLTSISASTTPQPSTSTGKASTAQTPGSAEITKLFGNLSFDKATATLRAEGPDGDAYAVIRKVLGSAAIEVPDQFDKKQHIFMEKDAIVGNCFSFVLHNNSLDLDVTNLQGNDRQRNEIKVYDGSNENLKGRKDMTFTYRWKFKPDGDMKASNRFTHLFQLKSTGSGMPILTITPRSSNKVELIHTDSKGKGTTLTTGDWTKIKGNWIEASVTTNYSHNGKLSVTLKTLEGTTLLSYTSDKIDMWVNDKEMVRPKWGIYRGLADGLNDAKVWFANFEIFNHSLK